MEKLKVTKPRALVAAALAALAISGKAEAVSNHPELNRIASMFAMRPVEALCYLPDEAKSPGSLGAWGYVNVPTGKQHYEHLDNEVCEGALNINNPEIPAWQRAIGALVLTHESYHLRRWGAAGNEAKVECAAIRHFKVASKLLGASDETVKELWPYALTEHYELANYTSLFTGDKPYYDPSCRVPPLFEE